MTCLAREVDASGECRSNATNGQVSKIGDEAVLNFVSTPPIGPTTKSRRFKGQT
jgi:hypothetical protein